MLWVRIRIHVALLDPDPDVLKIDSDPDRHALDADPYLDPAERCGSDPIRIHNTAFLTLPAALPVALCCIDSLHVRCFSLPNCDEKLPSCEGRDPRGSVVFSEATNSFGIRPPPPPVKGQEHARQILNCTRFLISKFLITKFLITKFLITNFFYD